MRIGNITFPERPLFLAPMESLTDITFRHTCKRYGADMVYTEFVASHELLHGTRRSLAKLRILERERPVGIQLYGHDIGMMVEATHMATEARPDLIDINFGCPAKKIALRGAGSGMMNDPDKMARMTQAIASATHLPVTAKTRLGYDDDSKDIVRIAEMLQDAGAQLLTIHGRTRTQRYLGQADWTLIGQVKANPRMTIPIVGNGDVTDPRQAKELFDRHGVDAIMIGRGAVGRPWIFREIRHFLETGQELPPISWAEKIDMALEHFEMSVRYKGEHTGVMEMRKFFTQYFNRMPDYAEFKQRLVGDHEPEAVRATLRALADRHPRALPA